MLVPTTDSIRNRYTLNTLLRNKKLALAVGTTGTGKSVVINGILQELDDSFTSQSIVFSAQSNSLKVQEMIESRLIKRSKNKMVPDGKKMVLFIDDLNMPRKDLYGTQPSLELLRQWMDYDGWFDRGQRDLFKYLIDVQMIAAMGPPGGGRAEISKRI
jgi:dynein heavy chain